VSWTVLAVVAVGLAMDAFAVSLAAGLFLDPVRPAHVFRLAFAFGFAQFIMPVIGWYTGNSIASLISTWDHWLAFGLLAAVGAHMVIEAFAHHDRPRTDPTRGWPLFTLAVATSVDALAVGLSLALLNVTIWVPALVIGLVAAVLSTLGVLLGKRFSQLTGPWAEALAGCVLIGIGVKVLFDHLHC